MQGIYINGQRPRSKKQIKDAAAASPTSIFIEATSVFGNEYEGQAPNMPEGKAVYFVGPDPYTKRNFYGQIHRVGGRVVVK